MAMDMDVVYNQYGQRSPDERREVRPPLDVKPQRGATAGNLDYWVRRRARVVGTGTRTRWASDVDQGQRSQAQHRYRSMINKRQRSRASHGVGLG